MWGMGVVGNTHVRTSKQFSDTAAHAFFQRNRRFVFQNKLSFLHTARDGFVHFGQDVYFLLVKAYRLELIRTKIAEPAPTVCSAADVARRYAHLEKYDREHLVDGPDIRY